MIILMIILMLLIPTSVLYIRFHLAKSTIAPSVVRNARVARYDRALRAVVDNRRSGVGKWL